MNTFKCVAASSVASQLMARCTDDDPQWYWIPYPGLIAKLAIPTPAYIQQFRKAFKMSLQFAVEDLGFSV